MASPKSAISVRFSEERRPEVEKFAKLLGITEGQLMKACFEEIAMMVHEAGDPKVPRLVYLLLAAQDYELSRPSKNLKKLDKALLTGYDDGTYRLPHHGGLVAEKPKKGAKA